jgi:hypothetical protein
MVSKHVCFLGHILEHNLRILEVHLSACVFLDRVINVDKVLTLLGFVLKLQSFLLLYAYPFAAVYAVIIADLT